MTLEEVTGAARALPRQLARGSRGGLNPPVVRIGSLPFAMWRCQSERFLPLALPRGAVGGRRRLRVLVRFFQRRS